MLRTVSRYVLQPARVQAARPLARSPSCGLIKTRAISSTSQRALPRTPRGDSAAVDLSASGGGKIQTIPFQIAPERGLQICLTAAHSAFGISYVFRLLLARFFRKWFGMDTEAMGGFFDTGVKRIAFKPVLLPVWKVDVAMQGKALLDQSELSLNISAVNASLPGFRLDPLDRLSVSPPFEVPPVPFSPSTHLTPFSSLDPSETFPEQPSVTAIPFTRSPLNILSKLASFPRSVAFEGLSLDPRSFKPILFAAYPMYIPCYLGEFELDEVHPGDEEKQRVTTVAFATVDGTAFAVYPQFLSPPTWLPSSSAVDLNISGRPSNPDDLPTPESLKNLKPKLEEAMEEVKERFGVSEEDNVDFTGITEVVRLNEGQEFVKWVEGEGRAVGYSEWAEANQEYIEAVFEADNAAAFLKQIESLPDTARPVLLSSTSLPKLSSREDLLASLRNKLKKAQDKVSSLKPEWLDKVEGEEKEKVERERRERVRERGARGRGRA
ncbi:hypothetical protein JCM11641_002194 [Rhodosporidiobolus odoratus]